MFRTLICVLLAFAILGSACQAAPGAAFSPDLPPPVWQIVFVSMQDGSPEIYRMLADGSQIVFSSDRGGSFDLYRMDRDGSHVARLTNTRFNNEDPCWSPDGRQLVYSADAGGTAHLYRMEIATGATRQLTGGAGEDIYPRCHP